MFVQVDHADADDTEDTFFGSHHGSEIIVSHSSSCHDV